MRDRVEPSGSWRFVGLRRDESRCWFRRGDFRVPRMRGCAFPGSEVEQSLGLDDSVPTGIIMQDRVESSRL